MSQDTRVATILNSYFIAAMHLPSALFTAAMALFVDADPTSSVKPLLVGPDDQDSTILNANTVAERPRLLFSDALLVDPTSALFNPINSNDQDLIRPKPIAFSTMSDPSDHDALRVSSDTASSATPSPFNSDDQGPECYMTRFIAERPYFSDSGAQRRDPDSFSSSKPHLESLKDHNASRFKSSVFSSNSKNINHGALSSNSSSAKTRLVRPDHQNWMHSKASETKRLLMPDGLPFLEEATEFAEKFLEHFSTINKADIPASAYAQIERSLRDETPIPRINEKLIKYLYFPKYPWVERELTLRNKILDPYRFDYFDFYHHYSIDLINPADVCKEAFKDLDGLPMTFWPLKSIFEYIDFVRDDVFFKNYGFIISKNILKLRDDIDWVDFLTANQPEYLTSTIVRLKNSLWMKWINEFKSPADIGELLNVASNAKYQPILDGYKNFIKNGGYTEFPRSEYLKFVTGDTRFFDQTEPDGTKLLPLYVDYVATYSEANPTEPMNLFPLLRTRFTEGQVSKMIYMCQDPKAAEEGKKALNAYWIATYSTSGLFDRLNLSSIKNKKYHWSVLSSFIDYLISKTLLSDSKHEYNVLIEKYGLKKVITLTYAATADLEDHSKDFLRQELLKYTKEENLDLKTEILNVLGLESHNNQELLALIVVSVAEYNKKHPQEPLDLLAVLKACNYDKDVVKAVLACKEIKDPDIAKIIKAELMDNMLKAGTPPAKLCTDLVVPLDPKASTYQWALIFLEDYCKKCKNAGLEGNTNWENILTTTVPSRKLIRLSLLDATGPIQQDLAILQKKIPKLHKIQKISPSTVIEILQADKIVPIETKRMDFWVAYFDFYRRHNSVSSNFMIKGFFNPSRLSTAISDSEINRINELHVSAKVNPAAKQLFNALERKWFYDLRTEGATFESQLEILNLKMKNPDIAKDYYAFYHKIDKKVQIITKMDIEKQLRHFVEMAEDLDKDVLSDPWDPYELLQATVSKYDLAMIITASQKNEPSETIVDNAAMKMFKQFHASIKMGTFEDLVDLLELHKIAQEKDTLFSSLEWACLLDHIDQVKNNRFVIVDTIKFLKQYFDMEALVSLFPTLGKDSRTRHIIQPLVDDLATLDDNKDPEEVLRILQFNVENSQSEDITLFCMRAKVWMSFVTSYRKTIGNSFSAMKSLRKVYGDKKLAAMLAKAENTPGFRELAKHLQDEFLRALLNHDLPIENIKNKRPTTRAKPVADDSSLQTLLSDYHALRRDIHNMLRMPQEMTLEGLSGTIETVENWYNVGPNLEHLSKYSILRTRFGESEIADLVKSGRNSHLKNIQKMASTIYDDQISCNFSPETTSQILYQGSNKDLDFSSSAQLVTLQTHINSFNAYYPNSDRTLYTVLKDLTGGDEKAIIQEFIINAGEFSDEIPLQLWKEQMQRWINRELDPSIAFEMLPTMPVRKWPVFFKVQYLVHYLTHFNAATSKSRLEINNLYEIPDLKLTRRDSAPSLFLENSMLVVVSHVLGIPKDQIRKWLRYISFLSSENPTFKIEWDSVTVLRCFFPDDKLKLKLQKVAEDLRYETHAKTLLNDLNQVLFKAHHDKITEYLSSTSNLKVENKAFFAQPQMKFLSSDVELFNKLYPDKPTTLNAVLKAVLKEDDATFLQRVLSALDNDDSKEIVLRLYEEELQFWLKKKTPPTDFFNYLEGLNDLKFLIMVQYSFDFIQMIPKDDYAATITKLGAFEDAWKICTLEALRKEVKFDDAILIDKLEKFIEAKDTWNLKYTSGDKLPVKKNKQVTSALTDTILNEFGVVKDSKKKLFLIWVKYIDALHGETSAFRIKLDSKTLARSFFTPAEEEAIKAVRRTKTNVSKRLR